MAQGYYTLEEAAKILGMGVDDLKMMARKGDIRSFQDRGTWRFRVQDIQEMARQRGMGSEPDLILGESLSPIPKKKTSGLKTNPPAHAEDEATDIGREKLGGGQKSSKKSGPKMVSSAPKSPSPGPKSPTPEAKSGTQRKSGVHTPEPGSDSDVRLVSDDPNVDFGIEIDSDVRLAGTPPPGSKSSGKLAGKSKSQLGTPAKPDSGKRRHSEVKVSPPDSGVRLVPMDSDSDVRIVGQSDSGEAVPLGATPPASASDSDIRLQLDIPGEAPIESGMLTDEIDLDAELQKQQEKEAAKGKGKAGKEPAFPAESPFELSDTDYNLPSTGSSLAKKPSDSSSDFELTPAREEPLDLSSSDELEIPFSEEPVDSGISLEQESEGSDEFDFKEKVEKKPVTPPPLLPQSDSSEFELNLTGDDSSGEMSALEDSSDFELSSMAAESTGSSSAAAPDSSEFELTIDAEGESSSEFELTIDADHEAASADLGSDSEFELQLDEAGPGSSSEFELTIDDDMQLAPEGELTPLVAMEDEIVQTDLDESPLLGEDSGSDVVTLEEDLEDSDFDIDIEVDEESSSQVVALEEEEQGFDEVGVAGKRRTSGVYGDEGFEFEEGGVAVEEEERVSREPVIVERDVYAAPWSAMPVVVMLPCVVVMFLVGLMGFELVQSMSGYHEPGMITKAIGNMIGLKMEG